MCTQLNLYTEGLDWCGKALELDDLNVDVLCDRAELYIKNDMFEEAIDDYQTANAVENHPKKVSQPSACIVTVMSCLNFPGG
jgi:DnaJ family protein C protein 3